MTMHAAGDTELVAAQLGRPPQDVVEAAIVLEAWAGLAGTEALSRARGTVLVSQRTTSHSSPRPTVSASTSMLIGEIAFVVGVVVLGWWMSARATTFGTHDLDRAWRVALPISLGLQWALRRRYLAGPTGLGWMSRQWGRSLAIILGVGIVLYLLGGPLAVGMFVTWLGGFVITRLGHGAAFAVGLLAAAIGLEAIGLTPVHALAVCSLVAACVGAALLSRVVPGPRAPAPWGRALPAGLVGAGVMSLLVVEPTYGSSGRAAIVALTVVPSLVASMGAGWTLGRLWDRLPQALATNPATARGSRAGAVALKVFARALRRLFVWGAVLSLVVAAWSQRAGENMHDVAALLAAHLSLALAGLLVGVLDAFGKWGSALVAIGLGLSAAGLLAVLDDPIPIVACRLLVGSLVVAGAAIVPAAGVLAHPDHALAVTL